MRSYSAAFYQQDFLDQLSRQAECRFYGRGYSGFDSSANLPAVIKELNFQPDLVLLGHSFLNDNPNLPLVTMPSIDLAGTDIPVVAMLNKEYTRLEEKVSYLNEIATHLVLTHHHNLEALGVSLNSPSLFVPFAVDPLRFPRGNVNRPYDLGFTGLLQNRGNRALQPDTRIQIMKLLHYTVFGYPLGLRKPYRDLDIVWRSWTGNYLLDQAARYLTSGGKLPNLDYPAALRSARVWLNTPSPLGLVSTRYFECMASGSIVLAQESEGLHRLFPRDVLRTFGNLSDFVAVLEDILEDDTGRANTAEAAYEWVMQGHTWQLRVREVLGAIEGSL